MVMLIAAGAVFLGIHLAIAGTKLRELIVGAIGENIYLGLFALSVLIAFVWLCVSYNHAYASADNRVLYDLGVGFRNLAIPIVAVAFLLGVPGVLMLNPTSVRQENASVRGVLRDLLNNPRGRDAADFGPLRPAFAEAKLRLRAGRQEPVEGRTGEYGRDRRRTGRAKSARPEGFRRPARFARLIKQIGRFAPGRPLGRRKPRPYCPDTLFGFLLP